MARKKDAFKVKRGEFVYDIIGMDTLHDGGVKSITRVYQYDGFSSTQTFLRSHGSYPTRREFEAAVVRTKKAFAKALIG